MIPVLTDAGARRAISPRMSHATWFWVTACCPDSVLSHSHNHSRALHQAAYHRRSAYQAAALGLACHTLIDSRDPSNTNCSPCSALSFGDCPCPTSHDLAHRDLAGI